MDAKQFLGEPRALISQQALLHNAALLRAQLSPGTKICAIIKADAYGHGVAGVVDTLLNHSLGESDAPVVDALAVANIDEGANLPETDLPVLIFRPVENIYLGRQRQGLESAIRAGWILTVCSAEAAGDLARIAQGCAGRANVQIMIDTGMTRSGVAAEDFDELLARVLDQPALKLWGLCSHFACSESARDAFTIDQLSRFRKLTQSPAAQALLAGRSVTRHIANSGGVFFHPDSHLDMVRPGLALYGIDPACRPNMNRKLRPAMKWVAPLLMIRDVRRGTGVGYGQTWHAPRDTRIGLVPVGYADGYLRAFSSAAYVMLHDRPIPVVGRVSMDLITVDLGDVPAATLGDEVTLLDSDPLSPASVYQLSRLANTIPYELFCRIGSRIPRVMVETHTGAADALVSERA